MDSTTTWSIIRIKTNESLGSLPFTSNFMHLFVIVHPVYKFTCSFTSTVLVRAVQKRRLFVRGWLFAQNGCCSVLLISRAVLYRTVKMHCSGSSPVRCMYLCSIIYSAYCFDKKAPMSRLAEQKCTGMFVETLWQRPPCIPGFKAVSHLFRIPKSYNLRSSPSVPSYKKETCWI